MKASEAEQTHGQMDREDLSSLCHTCAGPRARAEGQAGGAKVVPRPSTGGRNQLQRHPSTSTTKDY